MRTRPTSLALFLHTRCHLVDRPGYPKGATPASRALDTPQRSIVCIQSSILCIQRGHKSPKHLLICLHHTSLTPVTHLTYTSCTHVTYTSSHTETSQEAISTHSGSCGALRRCLQRCSCPTLVGPHLLPHSGAASKGALALLFLPHSGAQSAWRLAW